MKTMKIAGICAVCGQISAILFLLVVSLLLKNAEDPNKNAFLVSMIAACLFSLISGGFAARLERNAPKLCGLLCGVFSAVISMLLSIIPGGQKPLWQSLVLLCCTVLFAFIASVLIDRFNDEAPVRGRGRKRRIRRKRR